MYFNYISGENITDAWVEAIKYLFENSRETFNLMVQIENPLCLRDDIKDEYEKICNDYNLLNIRQVSYTIFPDTLYKRIARENADILYKKYFKWFHRFKRKGDWGTYFHRMISKPCFNSKNNKMIDLNQLKEIISLLKIRERVYKTPYFISISDPIKDLKRTMGGPCLNYIALQLDKNKDGENTINLVAFYRNHNFLERAFGNYVGLGQLLNFLCNECDYKLGYLTCISSHAYISVDKRGVSHNVIKVLKRLVDRL